MFLTSYHSLPSALKTISDQNCVYYDKAEGRYLNVLEYTQRRLLCGIFPEDVHLTTSVLQLLKFNDNV
jgi:hypothetical protein